MSQAPVLRLPTDAVIRFVGDVHLGDGSRSDLFGTKDTLLVDYLRESAVRADAVVFMGDAIDLPQALSARRVRAAHPDVFREIERLSRQIRVIFVRGNHDWAVDYPSLFPATTTVERLEVGRALIWHGHALDPANDPARRFYLTRVAMHSLLERMFRYEFRVPLQDHNTLQNRTSHWFGYQYARALRRFERGEGFIERFSRAVWGDPGGHFEPTMDLLRSGPHEAIVSGHTHLPGVVRVDGRTYINAGSWAFEAAQVAEWNGSDFAVQDVGTGLTIGDEHYQWMLAGEDPGDFFAWWERHYRGRLRFKFPDPETVSLPEHELL